MLEVSETSAAIVRLGARAAYASGVVSAIGLAFLIALYASFAVGALASGLVFGWINDVLGVVGGLLMLPLAVALHVLLRPYAPILSGLALTIGIGAMVAIIVLQSLLVVGTLTFEEEIGPVSIAFLVLVVWLVMTGYLGSSSGALPRGVPMGLLAATYVGYPIWAFWLGRRLLAERGLEVATGPAR
jgi:hypothetical protein